MVNRTATMDRVSVIRGVWIRWTGTVEWNGGMDWTGMEWNDQGNVALLWACPTFDP